MTKYDYIKNLADKDELNVRKIIVNEIEEHIICLNTYELERNKGKYEYEIKLIAANVLHCFYPFIPIQDVLYETSVNIEISGYTMEFGSYQKYLTQTIDKKKLLNESRTKKLLRII